MSGSDLKHPDKVAEIIRLAVADQKSEDIASGVKECQTNLVFRTECSTSVKVWKAIYDALNTKNWDVAVWNEDTQRVFCTLISFCVNISAGTGLASEKEVFLPFFVEIPTRIRQLMKHVDQLPLTYIGEAKRVCLRCLANLVHYMDEPDYLKLWNDILEPDDGANRGSWVRMSRDWKQEYYAPLLQIFVKCSSKVPNWGLFITQSSRGEIEDLSGMEIFGRLLSASLHEDAQLDDTIPTFSWIYTLVQNIFNQTTLVDIWQLLKRVDNPSLPETFQVDSLLALLKFADGMIHDDQVDKTEAHLQVHFFIPIMRELVDFDSWIPPRGEGVNIEKLERTTSCIQLLLGIFQTCLEPSYGQVSRMHSMELALVLIDFLGFMHKRFIVQGLARTSKPDNDRLPRSVSDYFKGMRRDVIIILTLLMVQEKEVQNTIREKGGITLILAQTNIDDDNPYIKERATLCIRALLEGNEMNQQYIRRMNVAVPGT